MAVDANRGDGKRLRYLATPEFMADPYPVLARLRESTPAAPVEVNGFRMWAVTRYADVRRILADPAASKDIVLHRRRVVPQSLVRPEHVAKLAHESRRSLLDRDGEDHRRLRAVLASEFSPARLAQLRPLIERTVTDLLDGLPLGEPVDIIAAYARPLATMVICELVGLPEDERGHFPDWAAAVLTGRSTAEVEEGGHHLRDFALRMVALKRRQPRDDLYTRLLRAHEVDCTLDFDELVSTYEVLLFGGSEPVTTIGAGIQLLLDQPAVIATLASAPELFSGCVEEVVRYESPFRMVAPRFCAKPVVLDGVTIPAGELILMSPGAANRDPTRFPDPDRFQIDRDTRGHLGFGHGPHRCIGAELGRLETEIALRAFFERFPQTRLAVPADELKWCPGVFMRRLRGVPVILG